MRINQLTRAVISAVVFGALAFSAQASDSDYYTNSTGHLVHRPVFTHHHHVPKGASAHCGDGSYSFSQHHRGTCSHHGGVASWL